MLEVMVARLWWPEVSEVKRTASESRSRTLLRSSWHCRKMAASLAVPLMLLLRSATRRRSVMQVRRVLCDPCRQDRPHDTSARERIWLRNLDPESPAAQDKVEWMGKWVV